MIGSGNERNMTRIAYASHLENNREIAYNVNIPNHYLEYPGKDKMICM